MASEPARKFEPDNEPGNADTPAIPQPNMTAIQGGRADQEPASDKSKSPSQTTNETGGFFRKSEAGEEENGGFLARVRSTKARGMLKPKRLIVLLATGGIIGALFAFSGLFSELKMDHIMSNIDTQTFARLQGTLASRNTSYLRTYMELRLFDTAGVGGAAYNLDKDNLLFKNNVVKRSNPVWNWYRTLRSTSFESDVFNRHGVYLASLVQRDAKGKLLLPKVVEFRWPGGVETMPEETRTLIQSLIKGDGTITDQLKLASMFQDPNSPLHQFDIKIVEPGAPSRGVITDLVRSHTQPWQVFKRRQLRKDIINKEGTAKWSFFDWATGGAVTKAKNAKLQMRNRLLQAVLPDSRGGDIMRCVFGISACKLAPDTSDPANEAPKYSEAAGKPIAEEDIKDPADKQPPVVLNSADAKMASTISQTIAGSFRVLNAANWASLINTFAQINKAIASGAITAQVAMARGIQAMALYQTFETIRDQMKTGQLTSDQVNGLMENIANITASEAWIKVVDGRGVATALTTTTAAKKFCDKVQPSENDFAYLCNNTIIGGVSGAATLQKAWTGSVAYKILNPILKTYEAAFSWFGTFGNWVFVHTVGYVVNGALDLVKTIPGVAGSFDAALGWATSQLANLLGAGPILSANPTSGQTGNWLVQGGAFSAESSTRASGGAVTTPQSHKIATKNALGFVNEQASQQSFFTKYLSLSNQQSFAANSLFAVSQLKLSSISNIPADLASMFHTIASAFTLPFTHKAVASSSDFGYRGAEVAQIQTYDLPPQCLNADPLTMTPQSATNIKSILPKADLSKLTWDLLDNGNAWYDFLYKVPGADDPVILNGAASTRAEEVYNCALLDNSVRGDLGYVYGYTSDNGYEDSSSSSSSGSNPGGGGPPTGDSKQLAQQLVPYVNNGTIQCRGDGQGNINCSDITNTARGISIKGGEGCDVNALSPGLLGMLLQVVKMNHKFTLTALCSDHSDTGTAVPGHSTGQAVDFGIIDGVSMGPSPTEAWSPAKIQAGGNLDRDIASFMPKTTGFGQVQCHPPFDFLSGFVTFADKCHHQHVQVSS